MPPRLQTGAGIDHDRDAEPLHPAASITQEAGRRRQDAGGRTQADTHESFPGGEWGPLDLPTTTWISQRPTRPFWRPGEMNLPMPTVCVHGGRNQKVDGPSFFHPATSACGSSTDDSPTSHLPSPITRAERTTATVPRCYQHQHQRRRGREVVII